MGGGALGRLVAAALALAAPPAAAGGDAERGAEQFRKCMSCHDLGAGARNRTGPHLNDLIGRAAGAVEDFAYSEAMRRAGEGGLAWTAANLDRFLSDPAALVPGTRMRTRGLGDERARADLLAFLAAHATGLGADAPPPPRDPEVAAEVLAMEGDPEYGEYLAAECLTCHRPGGAGAAIPPIHGWMEEDFVVAMHAYRAKARPHPAMQMTAARLSDEEIAALAAYFGALDAP